MLGSRAVSGIFVLLVGMSLTLICPGHDLDGHHSHPHLALLGEPADTWDGAEDAQPAALPRPASSPTLRLGSSFPSLKIVGTAGTLGVTTVLNVATHFHTEEAGLSLLHILVNGPAALLRPPLHSARGAGHTSRASQIILQPDHPPPRQT